MTARGLRFSMTRANPKGKGGVKGGGGGCFGPRGFDLHQKRYLL